MGLFNSDIYQLAKKEISMTNKQLSGCFTGIWTCFVVLPLWYAIMFGVLHNIEAPTWLWTCFWVYVPTRLLGALVATFIQGMED